MTRAETRFFFSFLFSTRVWRCIAAGRNETVFVYEGNNVVNNVSSEFRSDAFSCQTVVTDVTRRM